MLCDAIPPACIQLRNLVLSAFPRTMRLPDPFTPNLKVDLLPEIAQSPRVMAVYRTALQESGLLPHVDQYLQTRQPVKFLMDLKERLQSRTDPSGYNVPLVNRQVVAAYGCASALQCCTVAQLTLLRARARARALYTTLDTPFSRLSASMQAAVAHPPRHMLRISVSLPPPPHARTSDGFSPARRLFVWTALSSISACLRSRSSRPTKRLPEARAHKPRRTSTRQIKPPWISFSSWRRTWTQRAGTFS